MRHSSTNPPTNVIPPGIEETDLVRAVEISGYPLQGIVAEKLQLAGFNITEEWGFIDNDTHEHRSLDLLAFRVLTDIGSGSRVIPHLNLLIECKRTGHPYVFFRKVSEVPTRDFPVVVGVSANIEESGGKRLFLPAPNELILNLETLPFVQDPSRCASFSKATPSGKRVELSGDEPFNKIVLPLIKALQYNATLHNPQGEPYYPTLLLCVCVLEAPMLLVESPSTAGDPILTPWVRILRLQAIADPKTRSHRFYGIDIIHIDALDWFLATHLTPFAEEFGKRAIALENIWKNDGIVSDLNNIKWNEIAAKPEPPRRR